MHDTQLSASVGIVADPDTQTDLGFGAGTAVLLRFITANWNVSQAITVTALNHEVAEGGHTSTILADPDGQVDVGAGLATAILLAFTATNWHGAQTITVTAVDGAVVDGDHTSTIDHVAVSRDATDHDISTSDAAAKVTDNDGALAAGGGGGGGGVSAPRPIAHDKAVKTNEDSAVHIT